MRIGRHMPTHSKMVKAAELASSLGCEAIQVFVSNPTGWRPTADDPVGSAAFKTITEALALSPVVIHAPYLINLASPDALIWEKSIALLTWTMQRGTQIGASYVVFHTGSHRGSGVEAGLTRIAQAVERIIAESPEAVMLLLENDVGAGNAVGHSFEQLSQVLHLLPEVFEERVGVCLDTAHLWGAGHDIGSVEAASQVLNHFDETVGLRRLKVLHLNDTEMALGSHRDVHARLGEGIIGEEGLRTLLIDPRLEHVAVILETPILTDDKDKEDWAHDKTQIAKAFALAKKL
ncbi:MAG: deoxyribonuclease IV [Ktedonobacteraceae bacterium]